MARIGRGLQVWKDGVRRSLLTHAITDRAAASMRSAVGVT